MSEEPEFNIEAKVAACWWANTLRHGSKMQSGPPRAQYLSPASRKNTDIIDVLSAYAAARNQTLDDEAIDVFEKILTQIIQKTFIDDESWEKAIKDPNFGCGCRVLSVDYGACNELRAAYQAAGGNVSVTVFPIKTIMWINPGMVKVQHGYQSEIVELPLTANEKSGESEA